MELSITRLLHLLRKDFIVSKKAIALFVVALFILTGFIMLLTGDEANNNGQVPPDAGEIVFGFLLFMIGSVFTLSIFREYRSAGSRIHFLATPASHFEKFLSKWLYTLPFYLIGTIITFIVGYTLFRLIYGAAFELYYLPLSEMRIDYYIPMIHFFVLTHAIAFLFATWFNRYPIPKAIISSFLIYLVGFLLVVLIGRLVLWDYFTGMNLNNDFRNSRMSDDYKSSYDWLTGSGPAPFIYITAAFLWVVSYFKVKEKEA